VIVLGVLSSQQIRALIEGPEPLVTDLVDLDAQLQPNGIDLTLASIEALTGPGQIGRTNDDRILAPAVDVAFDANGWVDLAPGAYVVRLNEAVRLPSDVMALAKPRSSLLRNGVAVHNAVWDAGYAGRSQIQLVVYNPAGFRLAKDARIVQMVFMTLESATDSPYAGRYQGEQLGQSS
jgi:dUTP pyrophosphatase